MLTTVSDSSHHPVTKRSQYYNENAPEKRFREARASCKISHMPRPTAPAPPPRRSHDLHVWWRYQSAFSPVAVGKNRFISPHIFAEGENVGRKTKKVPLCRRRKTCLLFERQRNTNLTYTFRIRRNLHMGGGRRPPPPATTQSHWRTHGKNMRNVHVETV